MENIHFHCTQCGECCRHIDRIKLLSSFDRGDGRCIYLDGNLCRIYDRRPDICNVEKMYEMYFRDNLTKEEFYNMNYQGCKTLKLVERNSFCDNKDERDGK